MKKYKFTVNFISGKSLDFALPEEQGIKIIERLESSWMDTQMFFDECRGINFVHVTDFTVEVVEP